MEDYKFTLIDLERIFKAYDDCGASAIRLEYNDETEKLTVYVKCVDDCEPYWNYDGKYDCSVKNLAILLTFIVNGCFISIEGREYPVRCEWVWPLLKMKMGLIKWHT